MARILESHGRVNLGPGYNRRVAPDDLQHQALRINQRYLTEVVEALGLCPWASSVRDGEGLRRVVIVGSEDSEALRAKTAAVIEDIANEDGVDIGLLIFPELKIENTDFRRLVSAMESVHSSEHPRDAIPLAMANFHPEAAADTSDPARLVPFIRRSPDPTIQLVRRAAMDRVRGNQNEGSVFVDNLASFMPLMGNRPKVSVADGIAKANLRTVNRVGVEEIEGILADIQRDRTSAYAKATGHG